MNDRQLLIDSVWLQNAANIAKLSKDKNTQIGSVILNSKNRVLGTGYNGSIQGIPDHRIPHSRYVVTLHYTLDNNIVEVKSNKYPFMVHSERNAIEDCARPSELNGATIYVTAMPCKDCAWNIVRHKIKRVVIADIVSNDKGSSVNDDYDLVLFMFAEGNVDVWIGNKQLNLTAILKFPDFSHIIKI